MTAAATAAAAAAADYDDDDDELMMMVVVAMMMVMMVVVMIMVVVVMVVMMMMMMMMTGDDACSWFIGMMSREEINAVLNAERDSGVFLVRDSATIKGDFVLSVKYVIYSPFCSLSFLTPVS